MSKNGLILLVEGNKYIQIDSWDDVLNRPNFVTSFDPKGKELVDVIGEYSFKEKLSCCLTNCNQPHNHGYLVLTSTGEETYIGNICGKKVFGEINFKLKTRSFDLKLKLSQAKDSLIENEKKLQSWTEKLNRLKSQAKKHIHRVSQISNVDKIGTYAKKEFFDMTKFRHGNISYSRKADIKEARAMEFRGEKPPYMVDELIGTVSYASMLYEFNDLKRVIFEEIESTLKKLSVLNENIQDDKYIFQLSNRVNKIEDLFNNSFATLEISEKFFTEKNLEPILKKMIKSEFIKNNDPNVKLFRSFLKSLKH